MRGKSGIVHTLDSFSQLAVEPVGKFTDKPTNKSMDKLTHKPADQSIRESRLHHLPSVQKCPGTSYGVPGQILWSLDSKVSKL